MTYLRDNPGVFGRLPASRLPVWFIPFGYAGSAILLGFTLPRIEARFLPHLKVGVTSGAAMSIYSSISAGMMALTAIVFSLVFVMVQFSATAYSPRLVSWMSRDPLLSHAIGVFTATFLYATAALAWVDRASANDVPLLSWVLAMVLLGASVGVFIGLVQSTSRMQIDRALGLTGDYGRQVIDVVYPPLGTPGGVAGPNEYRQLPITQTLIYSGPPRALQSLDVPALLALAEKSEGVIELVCAVGDTLLESTPVLRVYGGREAISEQALRRAIRTGTERTFEQDPKYSIRLVVDIAIRALSPAVNDPTTAVQALDQIEDLLVRLGRRCLEIGEICDGAGSLRLVIPVPSWEDFLELAFTQIRVYGGDVQVMRRMKALMSDLAEALPEERRPAIRHHQERLDGVIARNFPNIEDQLQASAEDREGLGTPRKRHADARD